MSSSLPSTKDRLIRGLQFNPQKYLKNIDEPKDKPSHDRPAKSEAILGEDTLTMRLRFRRIASNIKVIKLHRFTNYAKNKG